MNKVAIIIVVIGIILSILGVVVFLGMEENSRVYGGSGGVWKIEESDKGEGDFVVTMKGTYSHGRSAIDEEGNANLTDEDCEFVHNFTLTGPNGEEYFMPSCVIYDDTTEDGVIHVGYICKNNVTNQSECNKPDYSGLPDAGEYTWNTQDTEIKVYDGTAFLFRFFGSIISCCCGVVVLLIGIILVFTIDDPQPSYENNQDSNLFNQDTTGAPKSASGWDDREDYIRKEKTEEVEETKEEAPETDQKKGEYNAPPPE
jgi:uncharacterized membrane protein